MGKPFTYEEATAPPGKFTYEEADAPAAPPSPTPAAAPPSFPYDDPKLDYGSILPFAKDRTTGSVSLAAPEMIRQPARGFLGINQRLEGPLTPEKLHAFNPDEQALVMATGGVRPSIDAPIPTMTVRPSAVEARSAGYVLPPISASETPGLVSRVLSGWSGKIKTQQAASAKNQEVTNELATAALGLSKGTVLTDEALNAIRRKAGAAYEAVKNAIPTLKADQAFHDAVDQLSGANSHAAKLFPKIVGNAGIKEMADELKKVPEFPTPAGVELVKELRFNANQNLKAMGDPSKHALGLAQREAADAVDDLMQRNIEAAGQPGLIESYKAARRLIAKSYDVEGVTNSATGDVSARGLARLQDKGRPLADQLKTIADAAHAFPKAMQAPAGFGDNEPWSALDFFGSAAAMAHGNPSVAGMILARPIARGVALSGPFQNAITRGSVGSPATPILPPGLFPQPTPDLSQAGSSTPDLSQAAQPP